MSQDPRHPDPDQPLSPADSDALSALVDSEFDLDEVPPALRSRARRIADLLGLLDPAPGRAAADHRDRSALVDATLARTMQTPAASSAADPAERSLVDADRQALDALVASDWRAADDAPRQKLLSGLLALLETPVAAQADRGRSREDLISATMRRVGAEGAPLGRLSRAGDRPEAARSRFSFSDLASVAAMMLIGLSILWPTISATREGARRAFCETGLQNAGIGFGMYAADNQGRLPEKVGPSEFDPAPNRWWQVGQAEGSHSANLFALVALGYTELDDLSCPGNALAPVNLDTAAHTDWRSPEEVSYSYRFFRGKAPRLSGPIRYIVLVDKSPVVDRARRGEQFDPAARSINHRGHGQNLLLNDGSVRWVSSPVLESGDNLWLPRSLEDGSSRRMTGRERPEGLEDAFVGP